MSDSKRAVYYATDDDPQCMYRLRRSVQSLRRFNETITVYVGVFGKLLESDRQFFNQQKVTLIYNPDKCHPFLAKFHLLENDFPETELIYIDTDTEIFSDIEELFEKTGTEDFHAREAPLTRRSGYPYRSGTFVVWNSTINHELFDAICAELGFHSLPFFNLGLIVFKNGFHIRFRESLEKAMHLMRMFEKKHLPYPCDNSNILRELVMPLVLSEIPDFSWAFIDKSLAPFYFEFRANDTGKGIVMHVLSRFYVSYLLDFATEEERLPYLFVFQLPVKRSRLSNFFTKPFAVPNGKYRSGIAKQFLKIWVRFGGWLYRYHSRSQKAPIVLSSRAA